MSLTRSDYEMIVECLTSVSEDSIIDENTQDFYYQIVSNFIQYLSADNPRFDREKFLDALDGNGWNRINRGKLPIVSNYIQYLCREEEE